MKRCPPKQAYRLIRNRGHWYVVRADEITIFWRWVEAMKGRRHMPADFKPVQVSSPEHVRFCDFWEEDP